LRVLKHSLNKEYTLAFINEFISESDVKKYNLEQIDQRYLVGGTRSRNWTIDNLRWIYLRKVAIGREEYFGESTWTLLFETRLIELGLKVVSTERDPDGSRSSILRVEYLSLPDDLLHRRAEVLQALHEALTVYRDGGVFATPTEHKLTLDVSGVSQ
jgi:hypothetical protein